MTVRGGRILERRIAEYLTEYWNGVQQNIWQLDSNVLEWSTSEYLTVGWRNIGMEYSRIFNNFPVEHWNGIQENI